MPPAHPQATRPRNNRAAFMMKSSIPRFFWLILAAAATASILSWAAHNRHDSTTNVAASHLAPEPVDALQIVLTPLPGTDKLDTQIAELQKQIGEQPDHNALLERLGWAFVAKARLSSDPGFYTLAEQAANAIAVTSPDDAGALLLLGHIRDSQHRFAEAETIARKLVGEREFVFDFALLGDALMEQGKLAEAVEAYQRMVDLKPCLQTYSRVAHMRWLKGDLSGAMDATRLAIGAGSPLEPEPTAWAYSRLALYQLQGGELEKGITSTARALELAPGYAPALLMRGRLLLGAGKYDEAIVPLRQAAEISPLPEYFWTLAEALRGNDASAEAEQFESRLAATGARADPRTFALFLATRGEDAPLALRLASVELESRRDVFTYDAVAWAQLAAGDISKARENIRLALAEGTRDSRLLFHAGAIAAAAGATTEALEFFTKARAIEKTLLPSERRALGTQSTALLGAAAAQISSQ